MCPITFSPTHCQVFPPCTAGIPTLTLKNFHTLFVRVFPFPIVRRHFLALTIKYFLVQHVKFLFLAM
jgi:hypothetical protein